MGFTAFASVEAVAALLFLYPRLMRLAGKLLMGILLLAFGIHLTLGELQLALLVYVVGVAFVVVHGSVYGRAMGVREQESARAA